MKPTTSSKTGIFHTILFATATAFALASMTGCAAATGEETATASSDSLDGQKTQQEKVQYDPSLAQDYENLIRNAGNNGGGGRGVDGVVDDVTPPRKKQNAQ